jgi:DNA invertase Pin-like site-specific DNA recombinase
VRYIGYIRVSRDREGGISPDQQRKEIEHWAATPGTEREIVWLPPDTDYSGKSLDRPSMHKALELLRSGGADGLVVSKLDRLTRSVADLNGLIREAQAAGWNIVGLDVGVDLLTTNGKMVAQLIGAISEWYLDRITEEWAKVRRYKIEELGAHWGSPPLGYKRGRAVNGRGHDVPGGLAVDPLGSSGAGGLSSPRKSEGGRLVGESRSVPEHGRSAELQGSQSRCEPANPQRSSELVRGRRQSDDRQPRVPR